MFKVYVRTYSEILYLRECPLWPGSAVSNIVERRSCYLTLHSLKYWEPMKHVAKNRYAVGYMYLPTSETERAAALKTIWRRRAICAERAALHYSSQPQTSSKTWWQTCVSVSQADRKQVASQLRSCFKPGDFSNHDSVLHDVDTRPLFCNRPMDDTDAMLILRSLSAV